jgi:hypothetical protein
MSVDEAQVELARRIACYRHERPDADVKAARGVILHDDEDLRRAAYPLPEEKKPKDQSQEARAYRHCQERAAHFLKSGQARTLAEAHKLAAAESPALAAKAGLHEDLRPAKSYAGSIRVPNDIETKLRAIGEADLIELLVTIPGKGELVNWRNVLREWATLQVPRYPAGSAPKGPAVDAVNELTERIWQAVRQERLRRRGFAD